MKNFLKEVATSILLVIAWIFALMYRYIKVKWRRWKWRGNPKVGDFCRFKDHALRRDPVYRGQVVGVVVGFRQYPSHNVLVKSLIPTAEGNRRIHARRLTLVTSEELEVIRNKHMAARLGLGLKNRGMTC